MQQDDLNHQQVDEMVGQIVRRRVARKVIRDLHHQVDDIEHQVQSEKWNARFMLPLLLILFTLALFFLVDIPELSRFFSSLF